MNFKFWKNKNEVKEVDKMSFQETLDATGVPVVTFKQGNKKFNFLLDTGANYSVINEAVLSRIKCTKSNLKDTQSCGIDGNLIDVSFVNIEFNYKLNKYNDDFQLIDMTQAFDNLKKESGVTLHGILGNNFMQKYKYILDFESMVAYSKK